MNYVKPIPCRGRRGSWKVMAVVGPRRYMHRGTYGSCAQYAKQVNERIDQFNASRNASQNALQGAS